MAINLDFNPLLEPGLFSDAPWWIYLLGGAGWTIALAVSSFILALALGLIIGTLRTLQTTWIRLVAEAWIELFRNIPLIVQIFIWYFVVPELIPAYKTWMIAADPITAQFLSAFFCLGLFTSSRIAEQVRAGIESIPKGLPAAARALGLTTAQTYRYVLLPMAVRIIFPPLTSESMNLVKNTAVAITIGLPELTMRANEMGENTFAFFAAYCWATLLYVAISLLVGRLMDTAEKHFAVPGFITRKS